MKKLPKPCVTLTAIILFLLISINCLQAQQAAVVSSIKPTDLAEFEQQPQAIQNLIKSSLELTGKNLAYTFGSDTPKKGGMDCSGAICYLLKSLGLKDAPRMSHTIYLWLDKYSHLTKLEKVYTPTHPSLRAIQPGDLLFWEGTYSVGERNPPISHVMLYLGTLKSDGKGVLFGASSGRRYRGKKIHGVSVFDFKVPSETSKAKLVAYGPIPGIRNLKQPQPAAATPNSSTQNNKTNNPLGSIINGIFKGKKE